jgi:hypothetical protein
VRFNLGGVIMQESDCQWTGPDPDSEECFLLGPSWSIRPTNRMKTVVAAANDHKSKAAG